jgi:hypothetical protein
MSVGWRDDFLSERETGLLCILIFVCILVSCFVFYPRAARHAFYIISCCLFYIIINDLALFIFAVGYDSAR